MIPSVAREAQRVLEPYHAMIYFAPEAMEEYAALGLDGAVNPAHSYFPARAAAMGAVTWPTVQATFFNFSAFAVKLGIEGCWDIASPADVLAARLRGVDRALTRYCGDLLADVKEAADLAREATTVCTPDGRPLFAAHADLPWPDAPHLALWHAQTLLREYRGDGHVTSLVAAGLTGLEAAILHVAFADTWTRKGLQSTRVYSDEQWDAAVESLRTRGWLDADAKLTEEGHARREAIEAQTDALALAPWMHLGQERTDRLVELVRPLSRAISEAGAFGKRGPQL